MPPRSQQSRKLTQQTPKLVLLIHGIRTRAMWQDRIANDLKNEHTDVVSIGYEYLNVFEFLSPLFTRKKAVNRVKWRIEKAINNYPNHELIIIAHSFGTYCVTKILQNSPSIKPIRIIFCGSVVDADFKWDQLHQQPKVLNECGTKDIWPCIARSATWGFGSSGTFGFKTPGIEDRYHANGHSDYFKSTFPKTYWIPFISTGEIVKPKKLATKTEPPWSISLLALRPFYLPWLGWLVAFLILFTTWAFMPISKNAIVAIYPSDSFGFLCEQGFDSAMKGAPQIHKVKINSTSIADMKDDRTESIKSAINSAFEEYNVLGIVGPPISEIAYEIAEHIHQHNPNVPLFLTSAISAKDEYLAELRKHMSIFRVGSSIGQRAQEVPALLSHLLRIGKKIYFLVEVNPNVTPRAFGSRFFDEVEDLLINRDNYERIPFHSAHINEAFSKLTPIIMDENSVIFFMGLSYQLSTLIDEYYREQPGRQQPKATLIGWMNAHKLDGLFRQDSYYASKIIDISDFNYTNSPKLDGLTWQENFANRDAMIYHDSTLTLLKALNLSGQANSSYSLGRLAPPERAKIQQTNIIGVGGSISFDDTGENKIGPLIFLKFDLIKKSWTKIKLNELFL